MRLAPAGRRRLPRAGSPESHPYREGTAGRLGLRQSVECALGGALKVLAPEVRLLMRCQRAWRRRDDGAYWELEGQGRRVYFGSPAARLDLRKRPHSPESERATRPAALTDSPHKICFLRGNTCLLNGFRRVGIENTLVNQGSKHILMSKV